MTRPPALWLLLVLLANLAALQTSSALLAMVGSLLALVLLPGLALVRSQAGSIRVLTPTWALAAAVTAGTCLVLMIALLLGLFGLPFGPIPVIALDLVSLGLPLLAPARPDHRSPLRCSSPELLRLAVLLPPLLLLHFSSLAYAEFVSDEAENAHRALGIAFGLPNALFAHGRSPVDVLVAAALHSPTALLTEQTARLPAALFTLIGVLMLAALVADWFGQVAGLGAGLLLALNGYFLAFSRTLHYSSLVFLLSVAVLACLEAYRRSHARQHRWLTLAALAGGCALLAHYDALFVLPPAAILLVLALGRRAARWRAAAPWLALAAGLAALPPLLYGLPYLNSPFATLAAGRVARHLDLTLRLDSAADLLAEAALYLSAYQLILLIGLATPGLVLGLARPPLGPAVQTRSSARWLLGAALAWLALPLAVLTTIVRLPGTHLSVIFEGLVVLAGVGLAAILAAARPRLMRATLAFALLLALAPLAIYDVNTFLRTAPEVVRSNRGADFPLHWSSGRQARDRHRFGFPYHAGWKTVGLLFADGTLNGSYASNENRSITHWYTRAVPRCDTDPRYYILADRVQSELRLVRRNLPNSAALVAEITVQDQVKIRVFDTESPIDGPVRYAAETVEPYFERELPVPVPSSSIAARDAERFWRPVGTGRYATDDDAETDSQSSPSDDTGCARALSPG